MVKTRYKYDGAGAFKIREFDTNETGEFKSREEALDAFVNNLKKIHKLQQALYAERKEGVVFIFQAMDAAGKDGVIRTVFSTLTPHGVKEFCFKVPSAEELSHDFLWRFWSALPAKGHISIFNRSYYESVLVEKVHNLWQSQPLPDRCKSDNIMEQRYEQINEFEKYLYSTGTRVVKIFLNVSKEEQARRFVARVDTPRKNWKLSVNDIKERKYWNDYMDAFELAINNTAKRRAPWFVVPADHKWYARYLVSEIVLDTLRSMKPQYPVVEDDEYEELCQIRSVLVDEMGGKSAQQYSKLTPFEKSSEVAVDICVNSEQKKISEEKLKKEGFDGVRKLLAKGYILKSPADIVDMVADSFDDDDAEIDAIAEKISKDDTEE